MDRVSRHGVFRERGGNESAAVIVSYERVCLATRVLVKVCAARVNAVDLAEID